MTAKALPVALQIYTIRDVAENDFAGCMAKVAAMGYQGVELAGLYGMTPAEIAAILSESHLTPISAHVPYEQLASDLLGTVKAYADVGCRFIAIPYLSDGPRPGGPEYPETLKYIAKIADECKKYGITLLYHNHDFEFRAMVDGEFGLDDMYIKVPADKLQTELDTCWVKFAGQDPAAYIEKYAGRCPVVHLKDFTLDPGFAFRPVGHGTQDFPGILAAAVNSGAEWVVVEQDQPGEMTSMEAAERSREYLKSIGW